jgi:hypothetical protein
VKTARLCNTALGRDLGEALGEPLVFLEYAQRGPQGGFDANRLVGRERLRRVGVSDVASKAQRVPLQFPERPPAFRARQHPAQHDAGDAWPEGHCGRPEKHVDRRTVPILAGSVTDADAMRFRLPRHR